MFIGNKKCRIYAACGVSQTPIIYYTSRGDYCSRITMKELEEKLAVHNFFRCAKGYLVNMNHVEGFVGSDCVIHNVHIPVSRTRKKEFMNLLLQNLNME